jgi:hypothetical protein
MLKKRRNLNKQKSLRRKIWGNKKTSKKRLKKGCKRNSSNTNSRKKIRNNNS